jgi:uncharacterized protein (DUF1697 family)
MNYVALLRGINVGGKNIVNMNKLATVFESCGFSSVSTYINSGNVFFDAGSTTTPKSVPYLTDVISEAIRDEFGFEVPVLIKERSEIISIATAIPVDWVNKGDLKSDVAYLFPDADTPEILNRLPFNRDYIKIIYIRGAVFWSLDIKDYSKSKLNNIVGTEIYKLMTIRNVNTARRLAGHLKSQS